MIYQKKKNGEKRREMFHSSGLWYNGDDLPRVHAIDLINEKWTGKHAYVIAFLCKLIGDCAKQEDYSNTIN